MRNINYMIHGAGISQVVVRAWLWGEIEIVSTGRHSISLNSLQKSRHNNHCFYEGWRFHESPGFLCIPLSQ
jgi:hypothetical protein